MIVIEIPIASRCLGYTFSSTVPVQIQHKVDPSRYAQTIDGLNSIFTAPRYRYLSLSFVLGTVLMVALLLAGVEFKIIDFNLYCIAMFCWSIFLVVFSVSVQMRIRNAILDFVAGENMYYSQLRMSLSYRRGWCFESPLIIHDFGGDSGAQGYQTAVPLSYVASTGGYVPGGNLQPVQIYYTSVPT